MLDYKIGQTVTIDGTTGKVVREGIFQDGTEFFQLQSKDGSRTDHYVAPSELRGFNA